MSKKSRDLSIFDYFDRLQLEYVVAELRRKIYPKRKDKEYYERVMDGKREKIEDIAQRNEIDSIFTSDSIKVKYYNLVYNTPFPRFTYRSEKEKAILEPQDYENYYNAGEDFKVKVAKSTDYKIGKLKSVDLKSKVARIKLRHNEKEIISSLENISRIL